MEDFAYVSLESLNEFFKEFHRLSEPPALEDFLADLFDGLKPHLEITSPSLPVAHKEAVEGLDPAILESFLNDLAEPVSAVKKAGFFCDPWAVASLKRDEVRNAKVLAWLLDCHGSHGMGCCILEEILKSLQSSLPEGFLLENIGNYTVNVENCPDGDRDNRVDIEISGDRFYLIIEVKINAPEGTDQLNRYCRIAEVKNPGQNWAVLYLTPQGKASAYHLEYPKHVIRLSWRSVAKAIVYAIRNVHGEASSLPSVDIHLPNFLATTFAKHIRHFHNKRKITR
jgi:hypothetical protein